MKAIRRISHAPLAWVGLLILSLGLVVGLKWTVKAQDNSATTPTPTVQTQNIGASPQSGGVTPDAAGGYIIASHDGDIWNGTDSFYYVNQTLGTNGELVARVTGVEGTDPMAKNGVMVRETLSEDSRMGVMLVTLGKGTFFESRSMTGGRTVKTLGGTNQAPYWVKMVRSGDWLGGYGSVDGTNWTLTGWENFPGLATQVYAGLAVAPHNLIGKSDTNSSTVQFDQVSVGPADPTEVLHPMITTEDGSRWWHRDIGDRVNLGDAGYSNGVFRVSSKGGDIWDQADLFHYVYQPMGTNGQLVARIRGIKGSDSTSKAGVMMRENLYLDSPLAMMLVTRGHGTFFESRLLASGSVEGQKMLGNTNQTAPYWVKVMRSGDWLGGYGSVDGTNWTMTGWETIPGLPSQIYAGLAVSPHNLNGKPATNSGTAQFDRVSVGAADLTDVVFPVEGTGDGLLASYRNDSLLYLPGITNHVDSQLNFNWAHYPPVPMLNPDGYGVSWSGEIQAQFTEPYVISLQTRREDWVRVWVNEQLVIDGWRTYHPDGVLSSSPVNLTAGQKYLIRVEMYDNLGKGFVQLSWSSPSTPQRLIPQGQMYSQLEMDPDGSGLPVIWEQIYFGHTGVDPNADPDNDGLSNLQEYQYHTNPLKSDTDGDGLPDAWEIAHGLDPQYAGDAGLDNDNSGFSSLQDYLYGLDPFNTDVNNDGLPDSFEAQYLEAGPGLLITNTVTVAVTASGSQATNFLGNWQADGNDIYALNRRGGMDFILPVDNADKYVLNLIGTQNQPNKFETSFKLLLGIDGQTLGHYTLNGGYGTNGTVELMLPYLKAGTHTLHLFWDGVADYSSLRIKEVKLLSVSGSDSNTNGIKDWAENMIQTESRLDNTNTIISSYTSPICLEGRDPYPAMMLINQTNALSPQATTDGRWYVNTPLQADTQTVFQVSYQNGALVQTCTLQWLPVNLLTSGNTTLTIRKGDSLLFTALPEGKDNGSLQLTIGAGSYTGKAAKGIAYKFTTNGVFTVTGTCTSPSGSSQSGGITVDVVQQQNLPNVEPAAWTWMQRNLNLPNLAPEAVLQADSRLTCFIGGTNANGAVQLTLGTDVNEARSIIAKLGTNGPILDATQVQGFDVWSGNQAYTKILQVYPDGSQLVEMMVVASPVETNVTLELQPIVSGVMFDDGTVDKILTATNFDALGQCPVRFIRPASATTSVCNSIKAYQGNYQIGYRH